MKEVISTHFIGKIQNPPIEQFLKPDDTLSPIFFGKCGKMGSYGEKGDLYESNDKRN
jgi:hypothetical protein